MIWRISIQFAILRRLFPAKIRWQRQLFQELSHTDTDTVLWNAARNADADCREPLGIFLCGSDVLLDFVTGTIGT